MKIITFVNPDGIETEYVEINNQDGSITCIQKSIYDLQQIDLEANK